MPAALSAYLASTVDDLTVTTELVQDPDGLAIALTLHSTCANTWPGDASGVVSVDEAEKLAQQVLILVALARTNADTARTLGERVT